MCRAAGISLELWSRSCKNRDLTGKKNGFCRPLYGSVVVYPITVADFFTSFGDFVRGTYSARVAQRAERVASAALRVRGETPLLCGIVGVGIGGIVR